MMLTLKNNLIFKRDQAIFGTYTMSTTTRKFCLLVSSKALNFPKKKQKQNNTIQQRTKSSLQDNMIRIHKVIKNPHETLNS